MERRTQGAWIIHDTKKLLEVSNSQDFEDIELAGKCGIFLSNLAASNEQSDLNKDKVDAIAKVSDIKKTEIDTIKNKLKEASLIDTAKDGSISVLGITTSSVLSHTADIFRNNQPNNYQIAAITLSESISDLPREENDIKEYISDTYKLSNLEVLDLLKQSEDIGFVDYEKLDKGTKLYFNGNLFRREVASKTSAILTSLKSDDVQKITEVDELLSSNGCIFADKAKEILGDQLFSKLQSIGMYDLNEVSNSKESKSFITKPAAFSKYGNPFEEDALDLAKAFVSSLFYGMNYSRSSRGRIVNLKALLKKLIDGFEVGPATAIGEDYKILELKRVIKLIPHTKNGVKLFNMKLLKRDIGELAMQVLEFGDTTEQAIMSSTIHSGSVTNYTGPEQKRDIVRKKQNEQSKKLVANLLRTFRS